MPRTLSVSLGSIVAALLLALASWLVSLEWGLTTLSLGSSIFLTALFRRVHGETPSNLELGISYVGLHACAMAMCAVGVGVAMRDVREHRTGRDSLMACLLSLPGAWILSWAWFLVQIGLAFACLPLSRRVFRGGARLGMVVAAETVILLAVYLCALFLWPRVPREMMP